MSLENILTRCSLLRLKDDPEALNEVLQRRIMLADRRTKEQLEEDSDFDISRGGKGINVVEYLKTREAIQTEENLKNKRSIKETTPTRRNIP